MLVGKGEASLSHPAVSGTTDAATIADVLTEGVDMLLACGADDAAEVVRRRWTRSAPDPCAVVVGELGRGKSSLVNALLGTTVVPSGAQVSTRLPLSVTRTTGADDRAELIAAEYRRTVEHDELVAAVTTRPTAESASDENVWRPHAAAIALPVAGHPLSEVSIVDTPGVGGLDAHLAALTAASVGQACVLLVTCAAGAPLTSPEVDFIEKAAVGMDAVIIVLTKIDAFPGTWRAVADSTRRLMTQRLGRPIPVLGVSALRATQALTLDEQSRVAEVGRSGIAELSNEILLRLNRAAQVPQLDALRALVAGLDTADAHLGAELAVLREGGDQQSVDKETRKLATLIARQQEWEQYLNRDLALTKDRAVEDLDRRLDELRSRWSGAINDRTMFTRRKDPQRLTAEIRGDLQSAMGEVIATALTDLRDGVVANHFGVDSSVWERIRDELTDPSADRSIHAAPVPARRDGLLDPSLLTMGAIGSSVIGGALGLSAITGVGAALAGVWVAVNLGYRATRSGKQGMLGWLRELLVTTRSATVRILDLVVGVVRAEVAVSYRKMLATQIEEQRQCVASVKKAMTTETEGRQRRIRNLSNNRGSLSRCRMEAATLLDGLS